MKQELTLIAGNVPETSLLWENAETSWDSQLVYREMADVPVQIVDPVEELTRSVAQLEDMQARLRFMMREIRGMMKI